MTAIGHNNPPDPIDEALAPWADVIGEAENWLDGEPVQSEDQMRAVEVILKDVKKAAKAVTADRKAATDPLNKAWKDEIARWKPTEDDLARMSKGLVALIDPYKRKVAAEKEAAKRAAWEEAQRIKREAEAAAAKAAASDINAQREAEAAKQAALDAEKAALAASKNTEKGMRKVHKYEIEDHRAALHWIAQNDRDAITAFIEAYVQSNHKRADIDGVRQWVDREAF